MSTVNKYKEDKRSTAYAGDIDIDSASNSANNSASTSNSASNSASDSISSKEQALFVSGETDNKSVDSKADSRVDRGFISSGQSTEVEEDKDNTLLNLLVGRRNREQEEGGRT